METEILTPKQAAQLLGVTTKTLANWRRDKKGPRWFRFGNPKTGHTRYRRADIDTWIHDQYTREKETP